MNAHRLVSMLCYVTILCSCEEVTIFAEAERPVVNEVDTLGTVGACLTNEDCPQWACVSSVCNDGLCVPKRPLTPRLTMEPIFLDQPLVSVSVEKDVMIGLVGELSTEMDHSHSLGTGQKLLSWTLSAPYPESEASSSDILAYEEANWIPENQWDPDFVKISFNASVDPSEPPTETREPITPKAITLQNGNLWVYAGEQIRDLWWGRFGQEVSAGTYFTLASPAQSIFVDGEEAWVSIFDKGLERLSLVEGDDDDDYQEANARFNTPGRALNVKAGRSFVVVADGYAGLSLFSKRGAERLGTSNPARRLVTPPQELSTEGRTVHLDLIEDRVITAEYGLGVSVIRINAEGGLQREVSMELGGRARWVNWVDPYTALVWVDGRGVLALDLLTADQKPQVIAEIATSQENDPTSALVWSAHEKRFALLTPEGTLYQGALSCAPKNE